MSTRYTNRLARLEQRLAAANGADTADTVDVVLVAAALAAWRPGSPLPTIPPTPAPDTVQDRSERAWRVLLHSGAGHTTTGTTCHTCTPTPNASEVNR